MHCQAKAKDQDHANIGCRGVPIHENRRQALEIKSFHVEHEHIGGKRKLEETEYAYPDTAKDYCANEIERLFVAREKNQRRYEDRKWQQGSNHALHRVAGSYRNR